MKSAPSVSRILLYVRDPQKIADFYVTHFAFVQKPQVHDDLIEVTLPEGAFSLLLHKASRGIQRQSSRPVLRQARVRRRRHRSLQEGVGKEGFEVWRDLQGRRLRVRERKGPCEESDSDFSQGILAMTTKPNKTDAGLEAYVSYQQCLSLVIA